MTLELISLYKNGDLFIFSKFLFLGIFGSEEEISQKITPWHKLSNRFLRHMVIFEYLRYIFMVNQNI